MAVTYVRDKKERTVSVKLGDAKESAGIGDTGGGYEYEGLTLQNLTPDWRQKLGIDDTINGVVITDIKEGSRAERTGIRPGDVIIQVENSEITGLDGFKKAAGSGGKKRFYIFRRGGVYVAVF